jgi:hypothetical protein
VLADARVESATTCEQAMAWPGGDMQRLLEGEQVSDIEFEAELSGFADLFRAAARRLRIAANRLRRT